MRLLRLPRLLPPGLPAEREGHKPQKGSKQNDQGSAAPSLKRPRPECHEVSLQPHPSDSHRTGNLGGNQPRPRCNRSSSPRPRSQSSEASRSQEGRPIQNQGLPEELAETREGAPQGPQDARPSKRPLHNSPFRGDLPSMASTQNSMTTPMMQPTLFSDLQELEG